MIRNNFSHTGFLNRVRTLIQQENMLSRGDSVLVGLSGGADSVALFRLLLELREEYSIQITCAHVNHCLRGETARRDMKFTEELCHRFDVPLAVLEEDVAAYANKHHLSFEDAGRQIRYAFFGKQHTNKIAVAHTKDDNAETVLMNLIKGNLPLGIAACRENIIRPLLCVRKEEIYDYLKYLGQEFVTDETNFSTDYTRNKIRLKLIPFIEEHFNTNFTNTVYHSSQVLYREQLFFEGKAEEIYRREAKEEEGAVIISVRGLMQQDEILAKRMIRRAYYRICPVGERISYEHTDCIFRLCRDAKKGKQQTLPGGIVAMYSGDSLVLMQGKQIGLEVCVLEPGRTIRCDEYSICLSTQKQDGAHVCYPIRVTVGAQVTIRSRSAGDRLYFHNIKIHKKISDFFIDKKIPLHERDRIPLVCVNDSVRIVVGHFYEELPDCPREEQYYINLT